MPKATKRAATDTHPDEPHPNTQHLFKMLSTAMLPGINDTIAPNLIGFPTLPHRSYECGLSDENDQRWAKVWCTPHRSLAERRFPLVSTASIRTATVMPDTDRILVSESLHEFEFAVINSADSRVSEIQEQLEEQFFVDTDGKRKGHFFDFRLTLTDGRRIAVAVKPEALREQSGIDKIIGIFNARHRGDFADEYVVRSRVNMSRTAVANAETILWARKHRVDDDVSRLGAIAANIPGTFCLDVLLREFGDVPTGLVAAINLMDDKRLQQAERGLITPGIDVIYIGASMEVAQ